MTSSFAAELYSSAAERFGPNPPVVDPEAAA
jgi:hypothetical protein